MITRWFVPLSPPRPAVRYWQGNPTLKGTWRIYTARTGANGSTLVDSTQEFTDEQLAALLDGGLLAELAGPPCS